MIKLITTGAITAPHFVCDSCGKVIKKSGEGAAVFANFVDDGTTQDTLHVHKDFAGDMCMSKTEDRIRRQGNKPGWVELRMQVAYLVANIGLSGADVDKALSTPDI